MFRSRYSFFLSANSTLVQVHKQEIKNPCIHHVPIAQPPTTPTNSYIGLLKELLGLWSHGGVVEDLGVTTVGVPTAQLPHLQDRTAWWIGSVIDRGVNGGFMGLHEQHTCSGQGCKSAAIVDGVRVSESVADRTTLQKGSEGAVRAVHT
jgi:hypothetical protein